MDPQEQFGFKELFTHVIGEMAKAMCERPDENKQQQFTRTVASTHLILAMQPRDALEAMLAGQVVMLHTLMTEGVHDLLRGQVDRMRRGTRANIVAINKAFHVNLDRLELYQSRRSEGVRDGTEQPTKAPPGNEAIPAAKAAAPPPAQLLQSETKPTPPSVAAPASAYRPSKAQIAACCANPEAMAALEVNDFARFARAMGVAEPSEAYLAAAAASLGGHNDGPPLTSGNEQPVR
jgi:hypothetical protein